MTLFKYLIPALFIWAYIKYKPSLDTADDWLILWYNSSQSNKRKYIKLWKQ